MGRVFAAKPVDPSSVPGSHVGRQSVTSAGCPSAKCIHKHAHIKKTTTTKNFNFYCCSTGRWWQTCLFLVLAVDWPTSFQTNVLSLSCISSPSVFILNKVSLTSLTGLILVTVHLSLQSSWGNEPEPPGLDEIKHFQGIIRQWLSMCDHHYWCFCCVCVCRLAHCSLLKAERLTSAEFLID